MKLISLPLIPNIPKEVSSIPGAQRNGARGESLHPERSIAVSKCYFEFQVRKKFPWIGSVGNKSKPAKLKLARIHVHTHTQE